QGVYSICITLFSIIPAVIICQIRSFHRSLGKDFSIRRRRFECKLLLCPGFLLSKRSLHIYNSQIILTENRLYFFKKVGWVSHRIINSCKTTFVVKTFICPQCAVSCCAHRRSEEHTSELQSR